MLQVSQNPSHVFSQKRKSDKHVRIIYDLCGLVPEESTGTKI